MAAPSGSETGGCVESEARAEATSEPLQQQYLLPATGSEYLAKQALLEFCLDPDDIKDIP